MALIGSLAINVVARTSSLQRGLTRARKKLARFSTGILSAGKSLTGGLLSPLSLATTSLLGFGGIAAGLGFGVKLAADAEQARVGFTTMLGSAEKADSLLRDIGEFAKSTPFQLTELRDSGRQLLAFGVAGEDVLGTMKTLGDISAGTQKPIGDFVDIFGKVKASGVAAMGDINRLADRGVPIFQVLAKQLGVNTSELRKIVGQGKVGFEDIKGALESVVAEGGLFNDAMAAQSLTLSGLVSTMKDNFLAVLTDVGAAAIEAFDFKALASGATEFATEFGEGLKGALPMLVEIGKSLTAWIGSFGTAKLTASSLTETIVSGAKFGAKAVGVVLDIFHTLNLGVKLGQVAFTNYFALILKGWKMVGQVIDAVSVAVFGTKTSFGEFATAFSDSMTATAKKVNKEFNAALIADPPSKALLAEFDRIEQRVKLAAEKKIAPVETEPVVKPEFDGSKVKGALADTFNLFSGIGQAIVGRAEKDIQKSILPKKAFAAAAGVEKGSAAAFRAANANRFAKSGPEQQVEELKQIKKGIGKLVALAKGDGATVIENVFGSFGLGGA